MKRLLCALALGGCAAGPHALPSRPVVLLVLAHPDDETMMGALLERLQDVGATVHALYLTNGEGGKHVDEHGKVDESLGPPPRLVELSAALDFFGVQLAGLLSAPDAALRDPAGKPTRDPAPFLDGTMWPRDLGDRISAAALRIQPTFVITLVPDGGVVHAHHQASGALTVQLAAAGRLGSRLEAVYAVEEQGWYTTDELRLADHPHVACNTQQLSSSRGTYRDLAAQGAMLHASQAAGHRGLGPAVEQYRKLDGSGDPLAAICSGR